MRLLMIYNPVNACSRSTLSTCNGHGQQLSANARESNVGIHKKIGEITLTK